MSTETALLVDKKSEDTLSQCCHCLTKLRPSRFSISSILILATSFFSFMLVCASSSVISPFFPGVCLSKGISIPVSGLLFGVFELVNFIFSPFVVFISTKIGNKVLFVGGLLISSVCWLLFAFLEYCPNGVLFAVLVIILRAVSAIGASILFVAAFATLASVFPDRLSTVNGVVETGLSIGYTLGPGIGGVLFDVGGFKLPLLTVGGLLLLLAFAAIVVIPSVSDDGHEKPVSFVSFLRIPLVVVIMLTFFIIGILEDTICVVIEPFLLDKFEFSHSVIGLLLMIPFFSLSLCAILFGYLSDYMKWGAGIAFFGILCCALSMFLIDPPRLLIPVRFGLVTLIAGLILMGIGVSASMVPIYALCLEEACRHGFEDNAATINLISSTSNSATSFGLFMGPVVGGSLYEAIGMPKLMLLYCGVLVLFSILFLATYLFSRRKSSVDLAEPS